MKRIIQTSLIAAVAFVASIVQADGPYQYYSITPCRVVDTRVAGQGPAIANQQTRAIQVQGLCGVPVGAKAVSVNLTAVSPAAAGFMTLFASGGLPPTVSTLNFTANDIVANGAIVSLGDAGARNDLSLVLMMNSAGSAHAIIDVTGYFK